MQIRSWGINLNVAVITLNDNRPLKRVIKRRNGFVLDQCVELLRNRVKLRNTKNRISAG